MSFRDLISIYFLSCCFDRVSVDLILKVDVQYSNYLNNALGDLDSALLIDIKDFRVKINGAILNVSNPCSIM